MTHRRAVAIAILAIVLAAATAPAAQAAHWRLRLNANFAHGLNTRIWTRYQGTPSCCKDTYWARSHDVVRGGILRLQNYRDQAYGGRWVSGGVSTGRSLNQTYGRWHVRFRMSQGRGVGMCIFLWPHHGWPPEVDFAEESSAVGGRSYETATLHYGSANHEIHNRVHADFQRWHTIGVTWTPGRLVYTLDGRAWAHITGRHVPNVPMHLGIQTHVGSNGRTGPSPDTSTPSKVGLQVDWVRIWRYR